uniref:Uncharacterized protein n=1 Tax=Anguilla anguilla TaxID=7936 RepID=A0A0E9SH32_ANGAN
MYRIIKINICPSVGSSEFFSADHLFSPSKKKITVVSGNLTYEGNTSIHLTRSFYFYIA